MQNECKRASYPGNFGCGRVDYRYVACEEAVSDFEDALDSLIESMLLLSVGVIATLTLTRWIVHRVNVEAIQTMAHIAVNKTRIGGTYRG